MSAETSFFQDAPLGTWGVLVPQNENLTLSFFTKTQPPIFSTNFTNVLFDPFVHGYMIGSHSDCEIRVEGTSKRHCIIAKDGSGHVEIKDMSKNGMNVNGKRLNPKVPYSLHNNDKITLNSANDGFVFKKIEPTTDTNFALLRDIYQRGRQLGRGSFGRVYVGVCKDTGEEVAIKEIQRVSGGDSEYVRREISILMSVKHPKILEIKAVFERENKISLMLELIRGEDLTSRYRRTRISEFAAKLIMFQILHALKYLHDMGVAHRDLKPSNVMLLSKNDDDFRLKVCDFGLAKILKEDQPIHTVAGTSEYLAPEILTQCSYSVLCDIWSTGVMLYQLLCCAFPFSELNSSVSLDQQIREGHYNYDNINVSQPSENAKSFISRMLTKNTNIRITAQQALFHEFMRITNEESRRIEIQGLFEQKEADEAGYNDDEDDDDDNHRTGIGLKTIPHYILRQSNISSSSQENSYDSEGGLFEGNEVHKKSDETIKGRNFISATSENVGLSLNEDLKVRITQRSTVSLFGNIQGFDQGGWDNGIEKQHLLLN
ncbi:hypothetical protein HK098_006878, partial [Nowakowskiella sp. JEL0407]